jgi:hypothetical protein
MTQLRRAFGFSLVAAVVGGGLYALVAVIAIPGGVATGAVVGTCFWAVIGFLLGLFGPNQPRGKTALAKVQPPASRKGKVPSGFSWFVYRVVVGYLVACMTTGAVTAAAVGLASATAGGLENVVGEPKHHPAGFLFFCGLLGANVGGLTGSLLGAFVRTAFPKGGCKPAVGRRAAFGGFFGLLLGALTGVLSGSIRVLEVSLVLAAVAGLLSGALGAALAALVGERSGKPPVGTKSHSLPCPTGEPELESAPNAKGPDNLLGN